MRLAMKSLNLLGAALLLSGSVLCNVGAQADVHVPYLKIGGWSLEYLEVGKLSGCRAQAQFPDQTIFQMALIQSGTDKAWVIFISNPKWNPWIGQRKQHRLWVVTTRADNPWLVTFSASNDGKTLSFTQATVEFMNTVADARSVEIIDENKQVLTSVDMKDSAAAIRAIVNCVSEHPPGGAPQRPVASTRDDNIRNWFLRCTKASGNEQSRREWMHKRHSSAVSRREAVYSNNIRSRPQ
jgi:hypothetical protein